MRQSIRQRLTKLAEDLNIDLDHAQGGLSLLWPFVEAIRRDGLVFVLKADGERTREEDGGAYTVFITGTRLGGHPCRADGSDVEEVVSAVVLEYADLVWRTGAREAQAREE